MKKLFGLWTSLFSLCFRFSSSGLGWSKSLANCIEKWQIQRVKITQGTRKCLLKDRWVSVWCAKERAYRHLHILPLPNDVKRGRTKWPRAFYIPRGQRGGAILCACVLGCENTCRMVSKNAQYKYTHSYSVRAWSALMRSPLCSLKLLSATALERSSSFICNTAVACIKNSLAVKVPISLLYLQSVPHLPS